MQAVTPQDSCFNCGRSWGGGRVCQFCSQVAGLPGGVTLSSPAKRLGGYLMELVLFLLTLVVGYAIWALIAFKNGQTPGKQVLGMKVVALQNGLPATWGLMFLREVIAKPVISVLSAILMGIPTFWLIWDKDNQELWDKMVGTVVVNDGNKQLA